MAIFVCSCDLSMLYVSVICVYVKRVSMLRVRVGCVCVLSIWKLDLL